mmetsp:Transcript_10427/g.22675  ORF Transcript_10427/g.22675 Transcript_10427/m.22675 type:complete len:121 (+) Transcript_10427:61-423(+)
MKCLVIFPLLLLSTKAAVPSFLMKNNRTLRRHRELPLDNILLGSSRIQRQRRNTYQLNGREYFVKKKSHKRGSYNKKTATTDTQKHGRRDEHRKINRKLDFREAKRLSFKNYHRNRSRLH